MANPPENTKAPSGLQKSRDHVQYPFDGVSASGHEKPDISNNDIQNIDLQAEIIFELESLCEKNGLPLYKARRAARVLLGDQYTPSNLALPNKAKVEWCKRDKKKENNPIKFLERHWKKYLIEDVLDQCSLRHLDKSLFEAIKMWCRNRKKNPQHYLPPPALEHARPERPATAGRSVRNSLPATQTKL